MDGTKKIIRFAAVFICLGIFGCVVDTSKQPSQTAPAQTTAPSKQKDETEAAADAEAEREKKAADAEKIKQRREEAAKTGREAAEKAQDKRREKATLAKLDSEARKNTQAEIAQAKAEKKARLAQIEPSATPTQIAQQKKQIEVEYREKVAKIKMKIRHRKEKAMIEQLNLPEDTSPLLTAKQLHISGNTLISTAELLVKLPLVYNSSDKPLYQADSDHLYDFRGVVDIILEPGRPRQVSSRTIQGLTQYILSVYQYHNFAGIYVYVPAEAIKDGVKLQDEILPIEVLEAPVTEVTITHYDPNQNKVEKGYLRTSAVQKWSPVKPGQVANQKKLDDFVNLLNLNPDRYVSAVVTKGAEPKSLAVSYDIYEADPWHWFWQIDNSGTRDKQWTPRIGLINTNLFGIDDTFIAVYEAPWDATIDDDYSLYGSYDFPLLTPRLRLNVYGGYSQYDISPETGDVDFIGNGHFYGAILRYNVLQTNGWFFDATASLSYERSKVTPSLFPEALGSDIKMWLWGTGVQLHRSDDMSDTSFTLRRSESMQGGSDKEEFETARTGAKPDFAIYTASAAHSQYIDDDKIKRLSGNLQYIVPNKRLVPAKMTTFGGMYTVRGYEEYEVVADGGILASVQYEFDVIKYNRSRLKLASESSRPQPKARKYELKKLAPLVFFDYGRAKVRHATSTTEKRHVEMFSVGAGTIAEIGSNFSGAIYYGYPLRATDDTRRGKGRINISLMMRW